MSVLMRLAKGVAYPTEGAAERPQVSKVAVNVVFITTLNLNNRASPCIHSAVLVEEQTS
jgi:hypothetical protein